MWNNFALSAGNLYDRKLFTKFNITWILCGEQWILYSDAQTIDTW